MKLLIPFLLLTLLAGCNSKTNTIRVDDSRDNSSSGGSSSGGTSGGGSTGGSTGGNTNVPGVVVNKGCTALGNTNPSGGTSPYIQTTVAVNGLGSTRSYMWTSKNDSNAGSYKDFGGKLYGDTGELLRVRILPLAAPSRFSKDQFGNICTDDPGDTKNSYTKMQAMIRVRDSRGNTQERVIPISTTTSIGDCSDIAEFDMGDFYTNFSTRATVALEVVWVKTDLQCIRGGGTGYGCTQVQDLPYGTSNACPANQQNSYKVPCTACGQFILQIETPNTLKLPPKSQKNDSKLKYQGHFKWPLLFLPLNRAGKLLPLE